MQTLPQNLTLLSALLFMLFFFTNCEKPNEVRSDYSISGASEMVQSFNKNKLDFQKGEYLEGPVEINIHSGNGITLIDFYYEGDSTRYLHYVLQVRGDENIPGAAKLENAEIIFLHRSLIVNSLTDPYRIFATVDEESQVFEPLKAIQHITHRPDVFGIIRNVSASQIDFRAELSCQCCTYVSGTIWGCGGTQGVGPTDGNCDAGGQGASSCSLSVGSESCSVACSDSGSACCWD